MTGEGVIYGDDLSWTLWGNREIFCTTTSISKEDAGYANGGTDIQWNIDLQKPVNVVGDEYINKAHSLDMNAY